MSASHDDGDDSDSDSDSDENDESWSIAVIGAGPAGLFAAQTLAAHFGGHQGDREDRTRSARINVYERKSTPAMRLLLAGRGGLNVSHSEPYEAFAQKYTSSAANAAKRAVLDFGAGDGVRRWAKELGVETFEGTSGRIFPREMRATNLLRRWLARLDDAGVALQTRRKLVGFKCDDEYKKVHLHFVVDEKQEEHEVVKCDAAVLSLGGASWPGLGSDGAWSKWSDQVDVEPLRATNCGMQIAGGWSEYFVSKYAGAFIKNCRLTHAGSGSKSAGDLIITKLGVEGGPVYGLGDGVVRACPTEITADLRPALDVDQLTSKLMKPGKRSVSERLRRAGVSPVALPLLREVLGVETVSSIASDAHNLAKAIKAIPLRVASPMPLDRAISTAGGVRAGTDHGQVSEMTLALVGSPGVFVCGEQLDWTAPTGGYLLTASFATGAMAAHGVIAYLDAR